MMDPRDISIDDYDYDLPADRIANHPLPERDSSKLLIWKDGVIGETIYKNIADHLPHGSLLVFNNTKVVPARILFKKETGGVIEIFCLEPWKPSSYLTVMNTRESVQWKCMIGGAGKLKSGSLQKNILLNGQDITITATLKEKLPDAYVVEISWSPRDHTFSEVLDVAGDMPLPPYIKRQTIAEDRERYQTIYADQLGSVAAPTAGLHFTEEIFSSLKMKGINTEFLTLHVGAGTFKPVKSETIAGHEMHAEWMEIIVENIEQLLNHKGKIFSVGTTSLRTLESIYWMGIKVIVNPLIKIDELEIKQWEVYDLNDAGKGSRTQILESLIYWMGRQKITSLILKTQIIIVPGYRFRMVNGLVTNFHQPRSTLLLLIAAITGVEWKIIYQYAMDNNFRFLSYGDGCLLYF